MSKGTRTPVPPGAAGVIASLVAVLVIPSALAAQFSSAVEVSSRTARAGADGWQSQLALSPLARFDLPRVSIDGRWTALGGEGQRLDGFGNLSTTYFTPSRFGLQLSVAGFADRALINETFAVSRFGTDARMSYRKGHMGTWVGREISHEKKSTPLSTVPRISGGAWRQWGNTILTISTSSFGSRSPSTAASTRTEYREFTPNPLLPDTGKNARRVDTVTVTDSGSAGTNNGWNDTELALHWSAGRLAFRGVVGTRILTTNMPNEAWGQVQGTFALAPDVALIAAGGVHPASAAYAIPRARFLELGFRVAPSALRRARLPAGVRPVAAAFEVVETARGTRTLRIRVPYARTVELSADFTGWKPIALARGDGDRWEATLAIPPGLHRLAIRVDGDTWGPPPGVSSVPDEFQGSVGVIIVR